MTRKHFGMGLSLCCLLLWSGSAFASNQQGHMRGHHQQHISQGYARGHLSKPEPGRHGKYRKDVVVVKKVVHQNRPLCYASNHGPKGTTGHKLYVHKQARPETYCGSRCVHKRRAKPCPAPLRHTRVVRPIGPYFGGVLSQPGLALSWNVLLD